VKTLTETVSQAVAPRRFQMTLLLLLAALAAALALIGVWEQFPTPCRSAPPKSVCGSPWARRALTLHG